jgi:hypothetical protein
MGPIVEENSEALSEIKFCSGRIWNGHNYKYGITATSGKPGLKYGSVY